MLQIYFFRIAASHRLPTQQQILLRILALGLAIGCAESGPPTAQSTSQKSLLMGPRVQRAPDNPRFHADSQLIRQGRRDDASGACVLEYGYTVKRGEIVAGRYSEIDLDTCAFVVQLGTYDRPLPSNRHADSLSAKQRIRDLRRPAAGIDDQHAKRPDEGTATHACESLLSDRQRFLRCVRNTAAWETDSTNAVNRARRARTCRQILPNIHPSDSRFRRCMANELDRIVDSMMKALPPAN